MRKWLIICSLLSTLGFNTGEEPDVHLAVHLYMSVAAALEDYGDLKALREEAYRQLASTSEAAARVGGAR